MKGDKHFEAAAPLGALLTMVLMTHERPAFLRRALQYYGTLPCKILVLDSSAQALEAEYVDFPHVDYRHLPEYSYWGVQAKLDFGVRQVTTPYMVFAADDDFVVHDALSESVNFLEAHPDYGMCHGYCLMYASHGNRVSYLRRDKKVCEDYDSEQGQARIHEYFSQYLPPFYAVTRTPLIRDWYDTMPAGTAFEWQEVGHVYYLLARGKARVLPIPYVVREINIGRSEHNTEIYTQLAGVEAETVAGREAFAGFLGEIAAPLFGVTAQAAKALTLDSFRTLAESLRSRNSLTAEPIFVSTWTDFKGQPSRQFGPLQYVEMPFYNQTFFDQLTAQEFLLHAMPAGYAQLDELEGIWVRQEALLATHANDVPETVTNRLWAAMDLNPFNRRVVKRLAQLLTEQDAEEAPEMNAWAKRLAAEPEYDSRRRLDAMPSGQLLNWLPARNPDAKEAAAIGEYLAGKDGGPVFGLLLLDLDGDMDKLQVTLDSLVEGHSKAFRVVVFTTAEPATSTTFSNTLHFVKVSASNYVDKLNQAVRQMNSDWLMLAEVGDQFTPSGLLRAGLELLGADGIRAVCADEILRQPNGALTHLFRPGVNLDLLQSAPTQMARHWLIRRSVFVEAGGYCADFKHALEFDLLLKVIEQGGLGGLAHLDEPLLISNAPELAENVHERMALVRHLGARGYKALVTFGQAGTLQIDYQHSARPQVSIILHGADDVDALQRSVTSILQRTRHSAYEVLVPVHQGTSAQVLEWLATREKASNRLRVMRDDSDRKGAAQLNAAARQAQGEYLVLLAANAEIVNPNWLGTLLNSGLRPEVGVVGAKSIDTFGTLTQAGLILGMNGGVGSPFVGEKKDAYGYMQRLLVEQNYSAVSATCLMVRKELFDAVGGLDEEQFAEGFADVDLCLKLGQAGYLTVWTPHVQIVHPGALPDAPGALAALKDKWAASFAHDLAYNRNLSLTGKGFTLAEPGPMNWTQLLA
ncbi:TIGR00180 family glycosyltransferase [Pseudomonas sp. UBA1879]|uniref:TIGR00180 family glycosyltransferase n=1 Tax=Pseudomonas sp. UBA1879 TaxID=1947305 RepID=UPI0025DE9A1E|nr:TIGR00180 family glycosyltransferase [Pseudomonas sp. UBA1879]